MTIACPDCGTQQFIPALPPRAAASCSRCHIELEKTAGRSIAAALALSVSTWVLLFPANILPLLRVEVFGMRSQNVIMAGIVGLAGHRWLLLALGAGVTVVVLPFIRFGILSVVLGALHLGRRPAWLGRAFRWAAWLDLWAMFDVYLLAACVGYYRLSQISQARIEIRPGGYCFLAAALLTMLLRACLDRRTVWRKIGPESVAPVAANPLGCTDCDLVVVQGASACPRCGARLTRRKPQALSRTTALLVAGLVLLIPANLYPMNISEQLGRRVDYTIFTGVRDLFEAGLWPLGVLIFCTSILVPGVKLLVIGWCVLSARLRWTRHLIAKTRLLRVVAEFGRWSKTDPFTIVFFVPLMNFGPLGSQRAGWGATAFMTMSFLTMAASATFDPRLMWDAARGRAG